MSAPTRNQLSRTCKEYFGNDVIDKAIGNGNDVIANIVAPANNSYCGKRRRK